MVTCSMVAWTFSLTALSAIDAPVREVTVYSDRARVVRAASLTLSGPQVVELPLLLETVDTSTLRVEAQGAEVRRVDVALVDAQDVPADEAKALLAKLEQLDDQISLAGAQRSALAAQVQSLQKINPVMPPADPLKPSPKLQPAGWAAAMTSVDEADAKLRARIAEQDLKLEDLHRQRDAAARQAAILGGADRKAGYRVKVSLDGRGPAKLTATYLVGRARWYPSYDIQYLPKAGTVQISFAGLVSQESGEDWNDAHLALSTAIPASATRLPKILTWKIGERERFIPTPISQIEPPKPPPPPYPPLPELDAQSETLRGRLMAVARLDQSKAGKKTYDFDDDTVTGELRRPSGRAEGGYAAAPAPPPPPPPPMRAMPRSQAAPAAAPPEPMPSAAPSMDYGESESMEEVVTTSRRSSRGPSGPPPVNVSGLGPPPAYRRPSLPANLPASAAGGYDLLYKSARAESVGSGQGARRVALFSQQWPVTVERKIFPALVPEAFLVAEIKNPSDQPLPSGSANLFVGDDPAGTAQLKLVSPGEQFTLPLGLDRAIRAIRNVRLVQTETGFIIGKEEITEYVVTIEMANPYSTPISITVVDQLPLAGDKNVEIKLLKAAPTVTKKDDVKGSLEWKLTLPANGKSVVSFNYTLKRPKSWRLYQ